jgi:hypothetical protein
MVYDLFPIAILWVRFFLLLSSAQVRYTLLAGDLYFTLTSFRLNPPTFITGVIHFFPQSLPSRLLSLTLIYFSFLYLLLSLVETPQSTCIFLVFDFVRRLMHSGYGDRLWGFKFFSFLFPLFAVFVGICRRNILFLFFVFGF